MKKFTFFWLDGKSEVLRGFGPISALSKAGYGHGSLKALSFWESGDIRDEYKWNPERNDWLKNQ